MVREGRKKSQLREVKIIRNYLKYPEGSCLIEQGDTRVICAASVEESVPPFLRGMGKGWVTAEYGMLPRASSTRSVRDATRGRQNGRTYEIQRMVGRALRAVVDFPRLGERTVWLDCDVIQADGGTRCASITGSYVALFDALRRLVEKKVVPALPLRDYVAAVSVGMIGGKAHLDLDYKEDSGAEVDMNVVMTGAGKFIEIQGTAEKEPFDARQMEELLALAKAGIGRLLNLEKKILGKIQAEDRH